MSADVIISGLFVFTEELGGCMAIQRKHPRGRRLWSLCHEYAHFLVHRYEPERRPLAQDSHPDRIGPDRRDIDRLGERETVRAD